MPYPVTTIRRILLLPSAGNSRSHTERGGMDDCRPYLDADEPRIEAAAHNRIIGLPPMIETNRSCEQRSAAPYRTLSAWPSMSNAVRGQKAPPTETGATAAVYDAGRVRRPH